MAYTLKQFRELTKDLDETTLIVGRDHFGAAIQAADVDFDIRAMREQFTRTQLGTCIVIPSLNIYSEPD